MGTRWYKSLQALDIDIARLIKWTLYKCTKVTLNECPFYSKLWARSLCWHCQCSANDGTWPSCGCPLPVCPPLSSPTWDRGSQETLPTSSSHRSHGSTRSNQPSEKILKDLDKEHFNSHVFNTGFSALFSPSVPAGRVSTKKPKAFDSTHSRGGKLTKSSVVTPANSYMYIRETNKNVWKRQTSLYQ